MRRSLWLLCIVGACYSPSTADGLPCSETKHCPTGQTCDLDTNTCWVTPPPAAVLFSVTAGVRHTCGFDNGGNALCWGDNSFGQLGVGDTNARSLPTGMTNALVWSMLSAGEDATCGIDNMGELYCWGKGDVVGVQSNAPRQITDPLNWLSVSVGRHGFCAVAADNTTWCSWNGKQLARADLNGPVHATSVAASAERECVVDDDTHKAYCWGANDHEQVLDVLENPVTAPREIPSTAGWQTIATGPTTTCAVDLDGHLWCWGECDEYRNGRPPSAPSCAPMQVDNTRYLTVTVGDDAACAVDEGHRVVCFGHNDSGELGRTTIEPWGLPDNVDKAGDFRIISVGGQHACATAISGADIHGFCWGSNAYGQLGTDEVAFSQAPAKVNSGAPAWLSVSTGLTTTCGIGNDHSLWCWGGNGAHQLADGSTTRSLDPLRIGLDSDWYQVSVGASHVCALKGDPATGSTVWCWGSNQANELGLGNSADITEPQPKQVGTKADWISIQAGTQQTCGVRNDPTVGTENQSGVYCWGANLETPTNLENGTPGYYSLSADANSSVAPQDMYVLNGSSAYLVPRMPPTADAMYSVPVLDHIARGLDHHCGLDAGSLYCWGLNESGELGRNPGGPGDHSNTAIREQKMYPNWQTVDVSGHSTCAIRDGGTLYCWGSARTVGSAIPTEVTGVPTPLPGTWSSVSLGTRHACGIHADDASLWCWGENALGELGSGAAGFDHPQRVKPAAP